MTILLQKLGNMRAEKSEPLAPLGPEKDKLPAAMARMLHRLYFPRVAATRCNLPHSLLILRVLKLTTTCLIHSDCTFHTDSVGSQDLDAFGRKASPSVDHRGLVLDTSLHD